MLKSRCAILALLFLFLAGCSFFSGVSDSPAPIESPPSEEPSISPSPPPTPFSIKNPEGLTLAERFNPPSGFEREAQAEDSFAAYLGALALKPDATPVYMFDGSLKPEAKYEAVLRISVGTRDLLQTTDLLIKLHSTYLYGQQRYEEMSYHFMSGFVCSFDKWSDGYRVDVKANNKVEWVKFGEPDASQDVFDKYLQTLYIYSNATAMAQDAVAAPSIAIGCIILKNGGAIIADMCHDSETGRTAIMLIRSGSPTQDAYVVQNTDSPDLSPWFIIPDSGPIVTPEGDFLGSDIMRFRS